LTVNGKRGRGGGKAEEGTSILRLEGNPKMAEKRKKGA